MQSSSTGEGIKTSTDLRMSWCLRPHQGHSELDLCEAFEALYNCDGTAIAGRLCCVAVLAVGCQID